MTFYLTVSDVQAAVLAAGGYVIHGALDSGELTLEIHSKYQWEPLAVLQVCGSGNDFVPAKESRRAIRQLSRK